VARSILETMEKSVIDIEGLDVNFSTVLRTGIDGQIHISCVNYSAALSGLQPKGGHSRMQSRMH